MYKKERINIIIINNKYSFIILILVCIYIPKELKSLKTGCGKYWLSIAL